MSRRSLARATAIALPTVTVLWLAAAPAAAHPLGNFTVSSSVRIVVATGGVELRTVVDTAEIPTYRARKQADRDGNNRVDATELRDYAAAECQRASDLVHLEVDGAAATTRVTRAEVTFPPGTGGLATTRVECTLAGPRVQPGDRIGVRSELTDAHVGWRELSAAGDGFALRSSDVPATSITDELRRYPDDLLAAPYDTRAAAVVVGDPVAGGGAGSAAVRAVVPQRLGGAANALAGMVERRASSPWFLLGMVALAFVLGGAHAFAPGHGKTVMAAYAVGSRAPWRQVATLGLVVTATHTLGVLLLGVALAGAALTAPERVYPLLGAASGLLLAAVGIGLLRRARRRLAAAPAHEHHDHEHHDHDHAHDHGHDHAAPAAPAHEHHGEHSHGGRAHSHDVPPDARLRDLLLLGLAGGLVPSPTALVVLLSALTLGRAWLGVGLVIAYGAGMAATLVLIGVAFTRVGSSVTGWLAGRSPGGWRVPAVAARLLPQAAGVVVVVAGLGLAARSAWGG